MELVSVVVPVRFSGGGLVMQTTTSQLGLKGAFIRSMVSPKQGAQVAVNILAPGLVQPLEVQGTVGERVMPGQKAKEMGFWVSFSVEGFAEKQLVAILEKFGGVKVKPPAPAPVIAHPPPPAAQPSRPPPTLRAREPRAPVSLRVEWPSAKEFLVAYSENISRGGLFIATDAPPPLREVIEISLRLPDGLAPVKTMAEVVQRTSAEDARSTGRRAGAGVQFVGANDEFRRRLDACMAKLLEG